jgi:glycosyltransferase involved in cell wall biosynthesis
MMAEPAISVVICAYNAQDTIPETLKSLAAQTSRNFEAIVIDDGSTDSTVATAVATIPTMSVPLRVISSPHGGLASARNRGVAVSVGEFVSFVDADDLVEPDFVEKMSACAFTACADIVVCEMQYVDFDTGESLHIAHEGDSSLYRGSLVESPGLLVELGASACDKLIRRCLFESSGISFPDGHIFEDLWTIYRLCAEARVIAKTDEPLYCYRVNRRGSLVAVHDDRYLQIADALAITNDWFIHKGLFTALYDDVLAMNYVHLIYGRYANLLMHGDRGVRRRYLRGAFEHMDHYFPSWRHSEAVRSVTGRWAKKFVFTHRPLLAAWSDWKARAVTDRSRTGKCR